MAFVASNFIFFCLDSCYAPITKLNPRILEQHVHNLYIYDVYVYIYIIL